MRISEKYSRGEALTIIRKPTVRKRTVTAFVTFSLVIAGMLAAAAPTVNLSGQMRIPATSKSLILACGGACPGLCPCPSELKVGMYDL